MNKEDVKPRKKQNGIETAGSTGDEAPMYPSEERARNPKEQQVMETSRTTPQPKKWTGQNCNTAGRGGRPREREKEPEMAR